MYLEVHRRYIQKLQKEKNIFMRLFLYFRIACDLEYMDIRGALLKLIISNRDLIIIYKTYTNTSLCQMYTHSNTAYM